MNIEAAYKEGPRRVYFLRRLGPFNACRTMQCMVHWCVVDSVKAVAEKRWPPVMATIGGQVEEQGIVAPSSGYW